MGTFGVGNFQSDAAADHLHNLTSRLVAEIEELMSDPETLEPDERGGTVVPCNVELLVLIYRQGWMGCHVPDLAAAERWRKVYMRVWKKAIDDLEPTEEYKRERRDRLSRTFDDLIEVVQRRSSG